MKRRVPVPTYDQWLDAVPVQNRAVRVESRGNTVTLWVPLRRRWWMAGPLSWILPFRTEKGVALDAIGTEVWSACDGQRRVEDIAAVFAERHRLRFHESRSCVTTFLSSLAMRKLIALAMPLASVDVDAATRRSDAGSRGAT